MNSSMFRGAARYVHSHRQTLRIGQVLL